MNKLTSTILVGAGLVTGLAGGIAYDSPVAVDATIQEQLDTKTEQVTQLETAIDQQQVSKILVAKDYIVSQLSSGRQPIFTGAVDSQEYTQALIEAYYSNGGKSEKIPENLNGEVQKLLLEQGKMLKCK